MRKLSCGVSEGSVRTGLLGDFDCNALLCVGSLWISAVLVFLCGGKQMSLVELQELSSGNAKFAGKVTSASPHSLAT